MSHSQAFSPDKSITDSDTSPVVKSTPSTTSFIAPKNKLLFDNSIEKLHEDSSSKLIL